ncbi:hypothetical protein F3Q52_21710 [Salmonella enterica subsp. enterica]|nr:hypothetical protein [Salmonella enterica subsp. enterica]ECW0361930.1 hypothetical protein [Salmonella enterica subsp. enterica]ECW0526832.1 hypothetical protein [Salmonella enterica subsp. enterica]ECW0962064.1 hypothetical protein [Salmonella enterica subsp. enterica]ECW0995190.1 hypothetical protein [Salmonella enterica subsp. enterica]
MIFLFNMIFRFLHMLMVFLSPQSAVTPWLRQRAEDALLMKRVAADIRLAGYVARKISRCAGETVPGAESYFEYTLFYAAHSLGWGLFQGLSSRWPAWLLLQLESRGACIDEGIWCEGRSSGFRDANDSRTAGEYVSVVTAER